MITSISTCESSGDEPSAEFMEMFRNPAHLDQTVRQAVQLCWSVLPKDRQNIEELEKQLRRVVERALKDFAEDRIAFAPSPSDTK